MEVHAVQNLQQEESPQVFPIAPETDPREK